jgi:hypothetical protein
MLSFKELKMMGSGQSNNNDLLLHISSFCNDNGCGA